MEKKKSIIPSTFFIYSKTTSNEENASPVNHKESKIKVDIINNEEGILKTDNSNLNSSIGVSGFSLKSIRLKKEIIHKNKIKTNLDILDNEFTIDDLMIHWNNYLKIIESNGNQNMLAILKMDLPEIKSGFNIKFNVANSINKVELNKELESMLPYLKTKLNNHKINFMVNISESNKSYVYTTEEKYEKMKTINPSITNLKRAFDLDI